MVSLKTDTPTAHHILSCTVVAQSCFLLVVRVCSHTLTSMHLHGSRLMRIFVSHLRTLRPRRAMSYTLQNLTPRTGTRSSPFPEPVFQHSEQPCEDQRPLQRGALTEKPPLTFAAVRPRVPNSCFYVLRRFPCITLTLCVWASKHQDLFAVKPILVCSNVWPPGATQKSWLHPGTVLGSK